MKTAIAAALATLALAGCVSEAQRAAQQAEYERAETNIANLRGVANVQCQDQASCDKAWLLAKNYVQQAADMKVRQSDDAAVETYNSNDYGLLALRAIREPQKTGMSIQLDGNCKGMYNYNGTQGPFYEACGLKLIRALGNFRPFVTSRM
jgi:hypothetical protein